MSSIRAVTQKDVDSIVSFIADTVSESGSRGVILGLSGGLDSAVVTKLSVMALGREHVVAVAMPSSPAGEKDSDIAEAFAVSLGIEFHSIRIGDVVQSLSEKVPGDDGPLDIGNFSARCRMSILYNMARKKGYLVIGTSNRSELMVGYFTKHGDGACDLMPLSNLYKTQVRQLSELISIPPEIISRPPSAGFWEGQTDEGELGMTYDVLDTILLMAENDAPIERICSETGQSKDTVSKVIRAIESSEHKRRMLVRS